MFGIEDMFDVRMSVLQEIILKEHKNVTNILKEYERKRKTFTKSRSFLVVNQKQQIRYTLRIPERLF